ncbi:CPBP family intramembrane metalloprotease [Arthrobacter sp. ATA002]|uniref:CPBP family intramembrane glutamic endopeptidase n=1 Tax=Arthrobacter sp. ATA002 TaxID=2991715 RepID=UPI0022A6D477|nr:CPBP family intramembrane glutamic endopeptidase [Arthrobacter sp. ATA002]WAP50578.1 CPBP family intramembrane metalloprotease [Arthrobacter sp. ATA002]
MRQGQLTGLIMAGTIAGMSIPLGTWFLSDPDRFVGDLMGFSGALTEIPVGWILALTVAAGYVVYTFWAVPFVRQTAFEFSGLKLLAVPLAIVTGVFEELVFRKLLMDWLEGHGAAWWLQLTATAVLFGVAHSLWGAFSRDLSIILPVALSTAALGAALGCVYLFSDRHILPAILAHTVINLIIEPALLRSSLTGQWNGAKDGPGADERPRVAETS